MEFECIGAGSSRKCIGSINTRRNGDIYTMPSVSKLTDEDKVALESLHYKQEHLRTAILSLAEGHDTGLFIYGSGGTGKSFLSQEALQDFKAPYLLHNSRLSAPGLVSQLAKAFDCIHWIEDAERLFGDRDAIGVMRSACLVPIPRTSNGQAGKMDDAQDRDFVRVYWWPSDAQQHTTPRQQSRNPCAKVENSRTSTQRVAC